ncbi:MULTISPECIES: VPA1262 family protein [Agrobacterium]|uniref:VPA1262 family protein n=1 Tax=Agrobacterium TaxID=357 RepID=UPI002787B519|nr:VPA1262 family protein [Agrobacterium sp. SORGH_AS_0745]MDP9759555.1 hypothetical protein [Agrobacterium tumefaciens]MDQ1223359.1 hypothetical protein [Agrobacterium sp. SORGH_AS_0745]
MIEDARQKALSPRLEDLISDVRLARLFSLDPQPCALQLWILQIRVDNENENRILYGRVLPYSFSNNTWSATEDDNFEFLGAAQAQVVRLNLYLGSERCAEVLKLLCAGETIAAISGTLNLSLPENLRTRLGTTALDGGALIYRPAAYLLNRGAHDKHSLVSPHETAGAFSASIAQADKKGLFRIGENYDIALTNLVVKHLNDDTGLDFGGADVTRFGDIELIVFPGLDDKERSLLDVRWTTAPLALEVRFDAKQVAAYQSFQFRVSVSSDDHIYHSCIAFAEREDEGTYRHRFELSEGLRARSDSTDIEIFGFSGAISGEGTLCCRWRMHYIREIHFGLQAMGSAPIPVKFDWLQKTARPSSTERVKAVLTLNGGGVVTNSKVGGREADPWVPVNRELRSLFGKLHPSKSEARFFQRWNQGDGEGRLQFTEWFKTLLTKYNEHQILIFDPYFEDAGLGLVLLSAAAKAQYLIFTSLPKASKSDDAIVNGEAVPQSDRMNNLMASCERNRQQMEGMNLRIYGLREGRLHDRYILVIAPDGLPAAGFNLSNSLQKAAENYPLLITPIPADTLLDVERYKTGLVAEAMAAHNGQDAINQPIKLLFEAGGRATVPRRYEPLRFLQKEGVGDILATWTGERSLEGLAGDHLRDCMTQLGLIKDDRFSVTARSGLLNCIQKRGKDFSGFDADWGIIGDVLAHTWSDGKTVRELQESPAFLEFLASFIQMAFDRQPEASDGALAFLNTDIVREPLDTLLHKSYRPDHFSHTTKYNGLGWADFFAIKLLWTYAPNKILAIATDQMKDMPAEARSANVQRMLVLSQIISEISQSVMFEINRDQRASLVQSDIALLHWLGLNAIETRLQEPEARDSSLNLIYTLPPAAQVQALGWMTARAARSSDNAEVCKALLEALDKALPPELTHNDLSWLVDSLRGHMHHLGWAEPWLFEDVISPLVQGGRVQVDDACRVWSDELEVLLGDGWASQSRLFEISREGRTTNISAYLFAHSTAVRQRATINVLRNILKRKERAVRQPLASTSNWAQWNDGLIVSMWIFAWSRWAEYYLQASGLCQPDLDDLLKSAGALATLRPIEEWKVFGPGRSGDMAYFLEQAEALLANGPLARPTRSPPLVS